MEINIALTVSTPEDRSHGDMKYLWAIVEWEVPGGYWNYTDIDGEYHCGQGDSEEECKADASIQITGNMDAADNINIVEWVKPDLGY